MAPKSLSKSEKRNSLLLLGLPGCGIEHPQDCLILLLSLLGLQSLLRLLLRYEEKRRGL